MVHQKSEHPPDDPSVTPDQEDGFEAGVTGSSERPEQVQHAALPSSDAPGARQAFSPLQDGASRVAGVVAFDYAKWALRFPSLAESTNETVATVYFDMAQTLFLNNAPSSLVKHVTARAHLLDLLVAHLAWIMKTEADGGPGAGAVGPVVQASQGSVSVQYALTAQPPAANWFMQSQYGATYWQATSFWRGMRFVASRAPRARFWP